MRGNVRYGFAKATYMNRVVTTGGAGPIGSHIHFSMPLDKIGSLVCIFISLSHVGAPWETAKLHEKNYLEL